MGAAALVLGLLSIILCFWTPTYGLIAGVVGIVLGAVGIKKKQKCSVGGLVLSIIGTVLCLILWLACAAVIVGASLL